MKRKHYTISQEYGIGVNYTNIPLVQRSAVTFGVDTSTLNVVLEHLIFHLSAGVISEDNNTRYLGLIFDRRLICTRTFKVQEADRVKG